MKPNDAIAQEANAAIVLHTGELSRNPLAGTFCSLFHIERESERSGCAVFSAESDPGGLETRRMHYVHWRHLPLFLANEELLLREFTACTEYEFVLVLDVSRSMTAGWDEALGDGRWAEHPYYRLKYLAYALLEAARAEGFRSRILLLDQGGVGEERGSGDEGYALSLLERLDWGVDEQAARRPEGEPPWIPTLDELAGSGQSKVIAVISDLLDPGRGVVDEAHFLALVGELRFRHRLLMLQVNRERDVSLARGGSLTERALHYGERGSARPLRPEQVQRELGRSRAWLGGTEGEPLVGRLAEALAHHGVAHQRFLPGQDLHRSLEQLTRQVLL